MPSSNPLPATDSAAELRPILGDDATATFEDDPTFVESNPTGTASSENVGVQNAKATPNDDDVEDDDVEDDDDLDEDEDDDEEFDDEEDDDEGDLDDEEDEDEDDDEVDDDDEDVEDGDLDDDADEVKASSVLRADGLLGYEDEAEDAKDGKTRKEGDHDRHKAEVEEWDGEKNYDPNSHQDGKWLPVERHDTPEDEGEQIEHRNDDPTFIKPYRAAAMSQVAATGASAHM